MAADSLQRKRESSTSVVSAVAVSYPVSGYFQTRHDINKYNLIKIYLVVISGPIGGRVGAIHRRIAYKLNFKLH